MKDFDKIVDDSISKTTVEYDKRITGFYDILRDKIQSRTLENHPNEREVLDWVLREIDDCEKQVKEMILGQAMGMREEIKKLKDKFKP